MAVTWASPDGFLLASLVAFASLIVLVLELRKRRPQRDKAKWIVIDGSNVMYWHGGVPKLETVQEVLRRLEALGYAPGVMFDANAGHLLEGRYLHDYAFGKRLGLPPERVMVVPKGVQADGFILTEARDLAARIVTNDRFRDWVGDYPEVATPGYLIIGGYRDGVLWLDL
jgi:hypothetical protein